MSEIIRKSITEKLNKTPVLDATAISNELSEINDYESKLDYLKKIYEKYSTEYELVVKSFSKDERAYCQENQSFLFDILYCNDKPITPIGIHEQILKDHFPKWKTNPQFSFWFLKYHAKKHFDFLINRFEWKEGLKSPRRKDIITAKLNDINQQSERAADLIKSSIRQSTYQQKKEKIITKVSHGYYKKSFISTHQNSIEVEAYCDQHYLKPYLEIEIDKKESQHKPKLNAITLREIALRLVYNSDSVTREKCKTISEDNDYKSGDALYNHFSFYSSTANRKGKPSPYTQKKLKNKIILFENVIKTLDKPFKNSALDELNILKTHYKNDFEEYL